MKIRRRRSRGSDKVGRDEVTQALSFGDDDGTVRIVDAAPTEPVAGPIADGATGLHATGLHAVGATHDTDDDTEYDDDDGGWDDFVGLDDDDDDDLDRHDDVAVVSSTDVGFGPDSDVRIIPASTLPPDTSTNTSFDPPSTAAAPSPAPAPRIIRIDDFGGSHEIDSADGFLSGQHPPTVADGSSQPSRPSQPSIPGAPPFGSSDAGASRVVTIADDDLPDAVFIKGSLDASGGTVVLIDDAGDEAHAPINNPAGTRRSIEPRLRDRRVAIKREAGRRRLRWALIAATVVVLVIGVATVVASPLFAVQKDQVTVTGAVYTDKEQLGAVIDELDGTPALRVDTKRLEAQLESIPWVETARVRIGFPHSATIDIRERRAMATYQATDNKFRVLDVRGRVLAVLDGYPIAYMLVELPDAPPLALSQQAPIGLVAAAELTQVLPADIRKRVKSISTVSDGTSLNLNLNDGTTVIFGPATDLIAKVIRLQTRLTEAGTALEKPGDGTAGAAGTDGGTGTTGAVIDVSTAETGG